VFTGDESFKISDSVKAFNNEVENKTKHFDQVFQNYGKSEGIESLRASKF